MKTILGAIILIWTAATTAVAGASSGGGGGAYVCRDGQQLVVSATMLDLWEANYIYGWPVNRNNSTSVDDQLQTALAKLKIIDPILAERVALEVTNIRNNFMYADESVIIDPPADAKNKYSKKNCPLEGAMYFEATALKLIINKSIFDKLETETDTAAAWLHEAIYKVGRDYFAQADSINARKIVGCLFSTKADCLAPQSVQEILQGKPYIELCTSKNIKFYRGTSSLHPSGPIDYAFAITNVGAYDYSANPLNLAADFYGQPVGPVKANSLADYNFISWVFSAGYPTADVIYAGDRLGGLNQFQENYKCTTVNGASK